MPTRPPKVTDLVADPLAAIAKPVADMTLAEVRNAAAAVITAVHAAQPGLIAAKQAYDDARELDASQRAILKRLVVDAARLGIVLDVPVEGAGTVGYRSPTEPTRRLADNEAAHALVRGFGPDLVRTITETVPEQVIPAHEVTATVVDPDWLSVFNTRTIDRFRAVRDDDGTVTGWVDTADGELYDPDVFVLLGGREGTSVLRLADQPSLEQRRVETLHLPEPVAAVPCNSDTPEWVKQARETGAR